MDTLDCIRTRRSIRKFKPVKIPEQTLYVILDAANAAPCAGNLQSWRFLVVEELAKIKVIAKAALEQNWIATAPTVVLMLSESGQLEDEYSDRGKKYDDQNVCLAAENLMLAAWDFRIGSCFVGSFTEARLRKEFKIPESVKIHAIIPLGYPAEFPKSPNKAGIEDLTSMEAYGDTLKHDRRFIAGIAFPEKVDLRFGEYADEKIKSAIKKKSSKKSK